MQRQVEEMGARSFQFYNAHIDGKSWRCDDEAVAYPLYEQAMRLGIDVVQFQQRDCRSATRTWRTCAPTTFRRQRVTSPTCAL